MPLNVAVQMDPIERINIAADSTFRIMEEAQARGHRLFYYTPDRLALDDGRVTARGWPVEVRRVKGNHFTLGAEAVIDLAGQDVVWLRQDPPFDMGYITTTHILERIHPATLVVNDPFWVRNYPEKLLVLRLPRADPADHDRPRPRDAQGVQGAARRHHPEAALRQRRRRGVPARPQRPQLQRALGALRRHQPRAADRAEVPAGGGEGRQAGHPRRRRAGRRDQPRARRGRDPVEHARRRPAGEGRAERPRPRDLRARSGRSCARRARSSSAST